MSAIKMTSSFLKQFTVNEMTSSLRGNEWKKQRKEKKFTVETMPVASIETMLMPMIISHIYNKQQVFASKNEFSYLKFQNGCFNTAVSLTSYRLRSFNVFICWNGMICENVEWKLFWPVFLYHIWTIKGLNGFTLTGEWKKVEFTMPLRYTRTTNVFVYVLFEIWISDWMLKKKWWVFSQLALKLKCTPWAYLRRL